VHIPTAAAASQLWRLPAGHGHGPHLSSETILLGAAASPAAPSASSCFDQLWSTVSKQWGKLGSCRELPYLQKSECRKEKPQPPSHSRRDRISEKGRSHALTGLGMATASKSSCLL